MASPTSLDLDPGLEDDSDVDNELIFAVSGLGFSRLPRGFVRGFDGSVSAELWGSATLAPVYHPSIANMRQRRFIHGLSTGI